jgi:hypothetical protein
MLSTAERQIVAEEAAEMEDALLIALGRPDVDRKIAQRYGHSATEPPKTT